MVNFVGHAPPHTMQAPGQVQRAGRLERSSMFDRPTRVRQACVRGAAVVTLCGVAALATLALNHSEQVAIAAVAATVPDPFDVPDGTTAMELSWQGYIRSATQSTGVGTQPAEIRALGHVWTDEGDRNPGDLIEWDDLIELGAIENAGTSTATITFASGMIVDLAPGDVLFMNNLLSEADLVDEMLFAGFTCTCTCYCTSQDPGCGSQQLQWECSETAFLCGEFNGDGCSYGNCGNGTYGNCGRDWDWQLVTN